MTKPQKRIAGATGLVLVIAVAAFFWREIPQNSTPPRLRVATSFYVLENFVTRIAGNEVDLLAVAPIGVDAHEFEPTPQDVAKLSRAHLIFYHGGGLDPWAERMAPEWIKNGATVININEAVGGTSDPHRWLDPVFAQQYIEIIQEQLIAADPKHADIYVNTGAQLLAELQTLNTDFERGLGECALREIIVSHDAFRYLGARYGFSTTPISGIAHEEEPSPKKIADLATAARTKGITTIFVEPLEAPDSAETLAKEIDGTILTLNPIEGLTAEERAAGKDYLQLMQENLAHLRVGMKCES